MPRNGSQVPVRSRSDERPAPPAAPPRTQTKPPSTAAIAQRAYAKYLARNGAQGSHEEDWLSAERELIAEALLG